MKFNRNLTRFLSSFSTFYHWIVYFTHPNWVAFQISSDKYKWFLENYVLSFFDCITTIISLRMQSFNRIQPVEQNTSIGRQSCIKLLKLLPAKGFRDDTGCVNSRKNILAEKSLSKIFQVEYFKIFSVNLKILLSKVAK